MLGRSAQSLGPEMPAAGPVALCGRGRGVVALSGLALQ